MTERPKLPKDANQRAKRVVDIATGEVDQSSQQSASEQKDPAAVELGRRGGLVGGKARSKVLPAEERERIARAAAKARWDKQRGSRKNCDTDRSDS